MSFTIKRWVHGAATRARTDVELTAHIDAIHRMSRGTYGAPRIHAELAARGFPVGCKRVARLMRTAGVQGVSRRKPFHTTVRDEAARPAPDLEIGRASCRGRVEGQ